MEQHQKVVSLWKNSGLKIPKIYYLSCLGKNYAVVEDDTNIVIAISKSKTVYAIAKNKISLVEIEDMKVKCYYVENPRNMRVISCTEETIKESDQFFVLKNILQYI